MRNLFVTDLDGTFVKDSVTVNAADLAAYHTAKELGDFSIATGRSLAEIQYIVQGNDLDVTHMIGFFAARMNTDDSMVPMAAA